MNTKMATPGHIFKLQKIKDKEKCWKMPEEKRSKDIGITSDLSLEIKQARMWSEMFKVLKEKTCQATILHQGQLFSEVKEKQISSKKNWRNCQEKIAICCYLQKPNFNINIWINLKGMKKIYQVNSNQRKWSSFINFRQNSLQSKENCKR
jgi:hypothetical protein